MDPLKRVKNFRDIKESIIHSKCSTNENIPSLNLEHVNSEKLSFKKLSTLRNETQTFVSPPKTLTISTNPIENIDFSSTKKKNKLLSYKPSLKVEEGKFTQLCRNDSTISNKSETSNDKRTQFNRFAKLAECNSKEKDIRQPQGLCFQRIASQHQQHHQQTSDTKSSNLGQKTSLIEPKRINFDEMIIKPKTPHGQAATPSQTFSNIPPANTPPTANTVFPVLKSQTSRGYAVPSEQRKESIESDYDKVNISQSLESSLDMTPFI